MSKTVLPTLAASLALAAILAPGAGLAAPKPVSSLDSFRVGDSGVLCTAQRQSEDARFATMFDRGYEVVCRDAASPVARLWALRKPDGKGGAPKTADADSGLAAFAGRGFDCGASKAADIREVPLALRRECTDPASGLVHVIYRLASGKTVYAAEGLAAYDQAIRLGLASLVLDRAMPGDVAVATTGAGDPAALARLQASRLDPEQALAAGYSQSADSSFAEASETFQTLVLRARTNDKGATRTAEYLANLALQQSILGNRALADSLFSQAHQVSSGDNRQIARLLRNLEVMHHLNARDADGALALLDRPLASLGTTEGMASTRIAEGYIDRPLAQRLELENARSSRFWGSAAPLTDRERDTLLDAQATYLRGVALRIKGDRREAAAKLSAALALFESVRRGSVQSMQWLDANISLELAILAEQTGNMSAAEAGLQRAITRYAAQYPASATELSARARLAGLQARDGKGDLALASFRQLVAEAAGIPGGSDMLREEIGPYFDLLVSRSANPASAADLFLASQAMIRPGVAQTQAVLARELSGGSDEAARLFREATTLSRELVSLDVTITRLSAIDGRKPDEEKALADAIERRRQVAASQTGLQAQLAAFPRYRVTSNTTLSLGDLQASLRGDEAYFKVMFVNQAAYALYARPQSARIYRLGLDREGLEALAGTIRDSIVIEEGNQLTTNPFDVASSYKLFDLLFAPVAKDLHEVRHLVFEGDGRLLTLPPGLLVTDKAGVEAYQARQKAPNPDAFDFTGVAWLARDHVVTTAVSARSFIDVRKIAPSTAPRTYLGLGQNTPIAQSTHAPHDEAGRDSCDWALSTWNRPISGEELKLAASLIGGTGDRVVTGDDFTDTALRSAKDLADYRVIQFATHGLVTAPHPGCPARPALVTSFGEGDSDGLLSFREIFDLRLNADTVILSACDTAGAASAAATREAGVATGGNFALDGLVRAFVGAGARTVVASHWPVPDDFHATTRLMTGIYKAGPTVGLGEAMRQSQIALMDDPLTSHPYYWAAFAIIGDATKPMTTR